MPSVEILDGIYSNFDPDSVTPTIELKPDLRQQNTITFLHERYSGSYSLGSQIYKPGFDKENISILILARLSLHVLLVKKMPTLTFSHKVVLCVGWLLKSELKS